MWNKKSINLERLVDNQWVWYCFLIRGADRPGHSGSAFETWQWAKKLVSDKPEEWRIVDEEDIV